MSDKTTDELITMLRRNYRRDLLEMRRAAVLVVEKRGNDVIQRYKYLSGRTDAINEFAAAAFNISLFAEEERET